MKTTIELPDDLFMRVKIASAREQRSMKQLIIEGLEYVLSRNEDSIVAEEAINRLEKGYRLGGEPLDRESTHER
ncbi:MAG: hypothetical protein AB3N63_09455 [Puniceicoccaceae bacterium]